MAGILDALFGRQSPGMLGGGLGGYDPMLGGDPRFGGGAAMAQLPGSALVADGPRSFHAWFLRGSASQRTLWPGGHRGSASPQGLGLGFATALAGSPVGVAESDSRCVGHVVTDGLFTSGSSPPRVATTQ